MSHVLHIFFSCFLCADADLSGLDWPQSGSVQVRLFLAEPKPAPPGSVQPPGEPKPEPQGPGSDRVWTAVQAKNIEYLC